MEISISRDLAYAVADEIGADVAYFRTRQGPSKDRLYITGIEIAVLVGTTVLTSFCLGFVKRVSEEVGEELGSLTAEHVMDQLKKVYERLRGIDTETDDKSAKDIARECQIELDEIIKNELPRLDPDREIAEYLEVTHEYEILEVKTYLIESGFPEEKASQYAERSTVLIRREWASR